MAAEDARPFRGRVHSVVAGLGGASFVRAATLLQVGSVALSGVSFVASVVLARTLGAGGYGLYTLAMSAGTTIGLLRRLGQDYAATTRLAEGHASANSRLVRDALVLYVYLSVVTSVVVLPPAIVLAPWLGERLFGDAQLGSLLQLYLVQGFWAVVPGWTVIALQASRRIRGLVGFEAATTLLGQGLPVALVLAGLGVLGVFYGQVVASLLSVGLGLVVYGRLSQSDPLFPSVRQLFSSIAAPGIAVWKETKFGLSIAADKNLVSLYSLAPFLLLGFLAPVSEVGQLRVAAGYMAIPAVLLTPVSRLLMVDLPQLRVKSPERVRAFFIRVTLLGLLASAALAAPFALASPVLVPLIYGHDFSGASPWALALLLDSATLGAGIAAGPIFRTYNRTDLPIKASLVILLLGLPAAFVGGQSWGAFGTALAYASMMLASRLVSYAQCLRIIAA